MKLTKLHKKAKVKGKIEFDDKCVKPTGVFRLSYPALFEPKEFKGKKSWSAQMLFEKDDDLTELLVAAQNAAIEMWGNDTSQWPTKKRKSKKTGKILRVSTLNSPFRDGDLEKPDKEEYENMIFIGTSCAKKAPEVFDQKLNDITEDDGTIKAGDYCRAKVVASAYEVDGSTGVKFTLLAIQKVETGEALGGGGSARDDFDECDYDEPEDMPEDDEEGYDEDCDYEEEDEDYDED